MEPTIIKPNRSAFVSFRFGVLLFFSLIALAVLFFVLPMAFPFGLLIAVLVNVFYYWNLSVQFRKAFYEFHGERIVAKGGGILSNYQTELIVKNITHVTVVRPFLRHKFFGVGNVKIESAGSGAVEIFLNSIEKPMEKYEFVQGLMKSNGFSLQKKELVQHEKPAKLGVLFEVFGYFVGSIFAFLWFGIVFISPLAILAESGFFGVMLVSSLGILIIVLVLLYFVFRYLDLINRDYWIYEDAIVYDEGFLTKHDSFIPIENISDSTLTQGLFEKIFSLFDITISCQGSAQEIKFKNIKNGELMEKNIDAFIEKSQGFSKKEMPKKTSAPQLTGFAGAVSLPETGFTGTFKMNLKRAVAPIFLVVGVIMLLGILTGLLFPMALLSIVGVVVGISIVGGLAWIVIISIIVSSTTYFINKKSIDQKFDFIVKKNSEFSNEKITGVSFKENFIDDWLGTFSVDFWSIGSSVDLSFQHLVKSNEFVQSIKEKFGVLGKDELYKTESVFSVSTWMKAWFPGVILGVIGIAVLSLFGLVLFAVPVLVVFVIAMVYLHFYYKTSKIYFYKDYVCFEKGIFFRYKHYALYDNIKDIATTKYPLSPLGTIKFNVAGEKVINTNNGKSIRPHGFRMNFMADISNKDELIDLIFFKRPPAQEVKKIVSNMSVYSPEHVLSAKPALANSLAPVLLLITGILLASLVVFAAFPSGYLVFGSAFIIGLILVIWTILRVRAKTYFIQSYRVVKKSGVIYKSQKSVIFSKIDHISKGQGALNKLFKNGSVVVNTTGSSMPELVLTDLPSFAEFYEELKKHY